MQQKKQRKKMQHQYNQDENEHALIFKNILKDLNKEPFLTAFTPFSNKDYKYRDIEYFYSHN